jgi:hypothetical protein
MLSSLRIRAAGALMLTAIALSACAETTALPTTLEPVEMQEDVAAQQAAFDTPATSSFTEMGYEIDFALASIGGVAVSMPMQMMRDGAPTSILRQRERIASLMDGETTTANAIPLSALGKTFVWNATTDQYEVSARTGAPANGVRFVLYEYDYETFSFAEPLVEVGYAQLSRTSNTATVSVFNGSTKVVEYTVTLGGTANFPTVSLTGFAGTGANLTNFNLAFGVSATTGNITTTWRTDMPSRGLTTRVAMAIGETSMTFSAVIRRGVRKVEMTGVFNGFSDPESLGTATLNVKVGDKLFARITINLEGVTIANPDGGPLSAEDAETLQRIFEWFESSMSAPDALLAPVFTLLDFDIGGPV